MFKRILFVCTGNTCRSPLAEGLFRRLVQQEGLELEVRSAGVAAFDGAPISEHSSQILKARGAPDDLKSNALTPELTEWADLILTMTTGHKNAVIHRFPAYMDKVFTLKEFVEDDPEVLRVISEREKLYSELEIKKALSKEITPEERQKLAELERDMPDFDIADPFGGTKETYEACAAEIENALHKLLRKLKGQSS